MARRRRWGQGNVIPPSTSGGTYAIRYHDKAGKRVFESGFTSEPLARQALEARRTDIARQRVGLPADSSRLPTLATLGDAWADRRAQTTRNGAKERANWRTHVRPALNNLHGQDVDVAWVRSYVEGKRATLSGATVRSHVRLLSMLLQDCAERPRETGVTVNTCVGLPRSVRAQIRPTHDPKTTPYIEKLADVERLAAALHEPVRTAFAVGVLAGLRTGEIRALHWDRVNLDRRQLIVSKAVGSDGKIGPTKNTETRVLPMAPELLAVLRARKLATGGKGLVIPSAYLGRRCGPKRIAARTIRSQTLNAAVRAALQGLGLERDGLDFYRATRHTYASHYTLGGGSLDHLSALLGHASAEVTLRYAHLRPQALAEADVARIHVDLVSPRGAVAVLNGQRTGRKTRRSEKSVSRKHNTT